MLRQPLLFVYCLLKNPVFWFTLTQSVRPSIRSVRLSVTYGTSCCTFGHQVLPTQPFPREVEDFPRGGNHSKHMPLLTCLA